MYNKHIFRILLIIIPYTILCLCATKSLRFCEWADGTADVICDWAWGERTNNGREQNNLRRVSGA